MKRILAISLMCILLLQLGMKVYVFTSYQMNKDYIAATLCENKAKPKMQCNGKCYLAKQMEESEQQAPSLPSLLKGMEEIFLTSSPVFNITTQTAQIDASVLFAPYLVKPYSSEPISIFQPPKV